jgi:CBS-domain-containing membrane protein
VVSNCVPVIDIYAKLVGIVSEGDLIRRVEIGTERRRSGAAGETLMSSAVRSRMTHCRHFR